MSTGEFARGLEGVVAAESAICSMEGGLRYRGYDACRLAARKTFDEVAYLLLEGELPEERQLADFRSSIATNATLPASLAALLRALPRDSSPMDVLRTAASTLGTCDALRFDNSRAANLQKSRQLLGQLPLALAVFWRAPEGNALPNWRADASIAENILTLLGRGEVDAESVRALDMTLVLYAEHELAASTFAARVVASTLSDLHAAVTAAIGALKGPLHGGANERVIEWLRQFRSPQDAERWALEALAEKRRVMGFGHRVYKQGDPRAEFLREPCRQLAARVGQQPFEEIASRIEAVMLREKQLHPNLDWPAARIYYYLGLPIPLYTPLFVLARVAGWCAHVIEQHSDNRLIRPRARYVGPPPRDLP
ncbi:MAG: citrate synthase [Pirellulaceae bacterium]|nr:MAG: citrate synthase [Pirellulaceae bacterium]